MEETRIKIVTEYIYLGLIIELGSGSKKEEIKKRIRMGWIAFGRLSSILRNNRIA